MDTRGKVAVITGGASGIGLALAERFLADGMSVVLADVDEPRLREVEARLSESGGDVVATVCDTASEPAVDDLARFVLDRFGAAHVLCNNAGVGGLADPWTCSMDEWRRVIDIDLFGVVHGIRAFLPIMQDQGEGHIVNTASMAGLVATPGLVAYGAAKHGVVLVSESLYLELKMTGSPVEVSVLCPGLVNTRIMAHEPDRIDHPVAQAVNEMLRAGIGHTGMDPADVAGQVAAAIRDARFWILTHEDARQLPATRMARAAVGENPVPAWS